MASSYETSSSAEISFLRALIAESVLGYVFWSIIHGLGPMIWFYPLFAMEISGYELFALVWISPILCGIGPLRRAFQTDRGLFILRILCVASLASFQAPNSLGRLITLAAGNFFASILLCSLWWNESAYQRTVSFWGHMIGFLALLSSRILYQTITPTWSDAFSNNVIITLGIVACLDRLLTGNPLPAIKFKPETGQYSWVLCGLGFGSLLFLTHWVFGEVSVVSRWVGAPYPNTGPLPNPWGGLVLIELATGLLMSHKQSMTTHFLYWWMVGVHSGMLLYYLSAYAGFAAGLILALFTMSVWPEAAHRMTCCPPGRTLTLALLTYLVCLLTSVWVVAYNFVPGGELTRERTYILMAVTLLFIGLALVRNKGKSQTDKSVTHLAFTNLDGSGLFSVFADAKLLLLLVVVVGLAGFAIRRQPLSYTPPAVQDSSRPKEFTAAIWTSHFMYDNRAWPSLVPASQLLNDTGADILIIHETDASKPFMPQIDITSWLGETLQMYTDFGPPTNHHTWGVILLSKYKIVKSEHHLMPSPRGELAPAITATINISGSLVDVFGAHFGNDQDSLDRKLQADYLANLTRKSTNPKVFLSYVTSKPGTRDYIKLTSWGKLKDIDSTDKKRFCEYIMYNQLIRVGYARVSHAGLSDTELQMAKFHIPTNPKDYVDNDVITTKKEEVDPSLHFNDKFGDYFVGHWHPHVHHYHMSTPKYFTKTTVQKGR